MSNDLSAREVEVIRHALGLNSKSRITYRNRFLAGFADVERWRSLAARGYAVEGARQALGVPFYVTRAGFEAVKRNGEKLGPGEERIMSQSEARAS